jgi:hypothetical protein
MVQRDVTRFFNPIVAILLFGAIAALCSRGTLRDEGLSSSGILDPIEPDVIRYLVNEIIRQVMATFHRAVFHLIGS